MPDPIETNDGGKKEGYLEKKGDLLKETLLSEEKNDKKDKELEPPLGRVTPISEEEKRLSEIERAKALSMGFVEMKINELPSKGDYSPKDIRIELRPASLEEIKHYSAMREEEQDTQDIAERLYKILERCYKVTLTEKVLSIKCLQERDKLFLLFYLRDLSMARHHRQNKLFQEVTCPHCGAKNKKEITNDIFAYYNIPDGIRKYYSDEERCFIVTIPEVEVVRLYIPTIGTQLFMQKFIYEQEVKKRSTDGGFYDPQFLKFLQFLVPNYTVLNEAYVEREYRQFKAWHFDKHEAVRIFSEKVNFGIKPSITFNCSGEECGKEIVSVLRFREGIRNLFNLSSVATGLFED